MDKSTDSPSPKVQIKGKGLEDLDRRVIGLSPREHLVREHQAEHQPQGEGEPDPCIPVPAGEILAGDQAYFPDHPVSLLSVSFIRSSPAAAMRKISIPTQTPAPKYDGYAHCRGLKM